MTNSQKAGLGLGLIVAIGIAAKSVYSKTNDSTVDVPTPPPVQHGALKISTLTLFDSVYGLVKGPSSFIKDTLRLKLKSSLRNSSGYDVTITDLNVTVEGSTNGTTWKVLGKGMKIASLNIGNAKTSTGKISVDFSINSFPYLKDSNTKYRTILTYNYNGITKTSISSLTLSKQLLANSLSFFNGIGQTSDLL